VRFRHGPVVHDFVRDTLREVLMESRPVSSMPMMPITPPASLRPAPAAVPNTPAELPFSEFSAYTEPAPREISASPAPAVRDDLPEVPIPAARLTPPPEPLITPVQRSTPRRIPDTHGALDSLPGDWDRMDSLAALPDLRPLGQLHESFIIAAARDGLWIIDQHVAHERVLFEQVLKQRAAGTVEIQQLLMPLVMQLSPSQQFEYARIADELNAYGFDTEPFGQRTIAIKAAPAGVRSGDIETIVVEILEVAESELRTASLDEIRRDVCATIACRAAIKVNMKLEPSKMDWLIKALSQCEYPMTCPHGRPIALRYSTRDILKSFHRI
jgi:DNA mismatch repair protein MutL